MKTLNEVLANTGLALVVEQDGFKMTARIVLPCYGEYDDTREIGEGDSVETALKNLQEKL